MDTYIIYFTIASLLSFSLAHKMYGKRGVHLKFSLDFVERILSKYKFIMWVNFFGGILRIVLMLSLVGFSLDNVMNYRLAANEMMNSGSGYVGLVFRLTAYVQMLANFYIALYGLRAGFGKLNFKSILKIFILYAPTQMATGGRLFVPYFILFLFGSFFLARGISFKFLVKEWILPKEKRHITFIFAGLLSIVSIIGMSRDINDGKFVGKESSIEKFSYVTEGMLATDYCMQYYPDGSFQHDNGMATMKGYTNNDINNNQTKIFTGVISGTLNGLTTLGGMPVALFLLVTSIQPAVIRGSLAALFFLTDIYAFILSFFGGIVDMTTIYRTFPLIIVLPIGAFIGNKFFIKSKEQLYRKVVFYFLIVVSVFGILRILSSI